MKSSLFVAVFLSFRPGIRSAIKEVPFRANLGAFTLAVTLSFLATNSAHAYDKFLEVTRFGFRPKLGLSAGLKKVVDLTTVPVGSVMRVHPLELLPSQESIGQAQVLQIVNNLFTLPTMAKIVRANLGNPSFREFLSGTREGKEFLYSFVMNFDPVGLKDEDLRRITELRGLLRSTSILANSKGDTPRGLASRGTLKREVIPQDRSIAHVELGEAVDQQLGEVLSGGGVVEDTLDQMAELLQLAESPRSNPESYRLLFDEFQRRVHSDPNWFRSLGLAELSLSTVVKAWNNRSKENQQLFADQLFAKYAETYEKKDASPGVIDPEQKIFISDGHHGLRTAYELMQKVKRYDVFHQYATKDFFVRISIDYNFSGQASGSKYYEYLLRLCEDRKLYFSHETRARLTRKIVGLLSRPAALPPEELQRKIGRSFFKGVRNHFGGDVSRVEDDQMRSFVGSAIPPKIDSRKHRLNIDNKYLVDYFEFYMAEWLKNQGFRLLSQDNSLLNSPRGAGEENYLDKQKSYIGHLVAVSQAKQLIYGNGPLSQDFEQFLHRMFDQNKFNRSFHNLKELKHPLVSFLQEREHYRTLESQSIAEQAQLKEEGDLTLLELLAPIKITTPVKAIEEAQLARHQASNPSLKNHSLFRIGSCLNPLGQSVLEVIHESRTHFNTLRETEINGGVLTQHLSNLSQIIGQMQDPLVNLRVIHYLENHVIPPVQEVSQFTDL